MIRFCIERIKVVAKITKAAAIIGKERSKTKPVIAKLLV
jgi:hypothetical protein